MAHPLARLFLRQKHRAFLAFLNDPGRPRRWFGVLGWILFLAWIVHRQSLGGPGTLDASFQLLRSFLALLFVLTLLGGLTQRGLPLTQAEKDHLLAMPFSPRALIAYRLAHLSPYALLTATCLSALMHRAILHPVSAFLAFALCHLVYLHVQTAVSIACSNRGRDWSTRLEHPLKILIFVLAILGFGLAPWVFERSGTGSTALGEWLDHPVSLILFHPAHAAAVIACEPDAFSRAVHATSLLGACLLTLYVVLHLRANLGESARPGASNGRRKALAEKRILQGSGVWPTGASAILWKGLLTMRRSWRSLAVGTLFCVFFLVPATFALPAFPGLRLSFFESTLAPLLLVALLPYFLHHFAPYDLRGEERRLPLYATLPLPLWRTTLQATLAPVLLSLGVQFLALIALAPTFETGTGFLIAFLCLPPLTLSVHLTANVAHFLLPRSEEKGELGGIGTNGFTAHFFVTGVLNALALLPAILTFLLLVQGTRSFWIALLAATLVQVVLDGMLLHFLTALVRGAARRAT